MEALRALLAEEESVFVKFSPTAAKPSEIADLVEFIVAAEIPIDEAAQYAPEVAQSITNLVSFPLTPYFQLMAARERLRLIKMCGPEFAVQRSQLSVERYEQKVRQLVADVGKKHGINIPEEVFEIYLVGLAERIRAGVFDGVGLPAFLMRAADYGANGTK